MHHDFTAEEQQIMAYIWPYMISQEELEAAERQRQWDAMSEAQKLQSKAVEASRRFV